MHNAIFVKWQILFHVVCSITNAGIYHIGTSVLEGINNKIKVIKRVAFGFRDFDYFFLRIMDAFRGKPAFA